MNSTQFFEQLEASIAKYDLLCHPFYRAWAAGELRREDLSEYARQYYHHVEAFPSYLAELAVRLDESELRRAVLANMCDEKGAAGESEKDREKIPSLTLNSGSTLLKAWDRAGTCSGICRWPRSGN